MTLHLSSRRGTGVLVPLLCALLSLCLCACVHPHANPRAATQPWIRDGQVVGTVTELHRPSDILVEYRDLGGRLARVESRDLAHNLRPGAAITIHEYDERGRLCLVRHLDAAERPCLNDAGFASRRLTYSVGRDSRLVIENAYLDCLGAPVRTREGWAFLIFTHDQPAGGQEQGALRRVQMLDPSRRPVDSRWLGVEGVAEAQYEYLEGIGTVVCVAFINRAGEVVQTRQLSGETAYSVSYTTSSGGAAYSGSVGVRGGGAAHGDAAIKAPARVAHAEGGK